MPSISRRSEFLSPKCPVHVGVKRDEFGRIKRNLYCNGKVTLTGKGRYVRDYWVVPYECSEGHKGYVQLPWRELGNINRYMRGGF